MKYIKYIAAALLLTASLASCDTDGVESGTPGNTTVQFAAAEVKDGFGAGVVYVPLTIESDTEEGMNSCSVQAKLKIVTTGEQFEGTPDLDGLTGDYRITSLDMNFPAYDNYYDKNEPEKYKDPETGKWVKQVNVEVFITNSEPEVMCFTLEIESSNTTIGEQNQCKVVLEKSTRDRMCGLYNVTFDDKAWYDGSDPNEYPLNNYTWTKAQISYNSKGYFEIATDHALGAYTYFYAYYDKDNVGENYMIFYPQEAIMWYSSSAMQLLFQGFYDTVKAAWASDYVLAEFDVDKGTITFPEEMAFRTPIYVVDENYSPLEFVYDFTPGFKGLVFTK